MKYTREVKVLRLKRAQYEDVTSVLFSVFKGGVWSFDRRNLLLRYKLFRRDAKKKHLTIMVKC